MNGIVSPRSRMQFLNTMHRAAVPRSVDRNDRPTRPLAESGFLLKHKKQEPRSVIEAYLRSTGSFVRRIGPIGRASIAVKSSSTTDEVNTICVGRYWKAVCRCAYVTRSVSMGHPQLTKPPAMFHEIWLFTTESRHDVLVVAVYRSSVRDRVAGRRRSGSNISPNARRPTQL